MQFGGPPKHIQSISIESRKIWIIIGINRMRFGNKGAQPMQYSAHNPIGKHLTQRKPIWYSGVTYYYVNYGCADFRLSSKCYWIRAPGAFASQLLSSVCARVYFGCPKTPCLHVHMQMPIQFALHSASAISLGLENAIVTIYHFRRLPGCSCHRASVATVWCYFRQ